MPRKKNSTLTPRAQEMLAAIERHQSSGLTQKAFCESEEIPYSTFQYWLKRHRSKNVQRPVNNGAASRSGFVPLAISAKPTPVSPPSAIEIDYPNGVQLRLPAAADISLLRELVAIRVNA